MLPPVGELILMNCFVTLQLVLKVHGYVQVQFSAEHLCGPVATTKKSYFIYSQVITYLICICNSRSSWGTIAIIVTLILHCQMINKCTTLQDGPTLEPCMITSMLQSSNVSKYWNVNVLLTIPREATFDSFYSKLLDCNITRFIIRN